MTPDRWEELERAYYRYADLDESGRAELLARLEAQHPGLEAELLAMVSADATPGRFLEPPTSATPGGHGPTAPSERLVPGTRLGPWRVLEWLAEGGMGTVHRAERADGQFTQTVAVKVLRAGAAHPSLRQRFQRERQTLALLNHPHVARLLDGGTTEEGLPYLVMEYVDGLPIDRACDERRLTVDERLALFATVCDAAHHLHQNLVVHRDVKPSNILVDPEGRPKLLDFGIAKLLDEDGGTDGVDVTRTGLRLMTPRFASPEQVRGEAVTTASDVYSLGVLLYLLLCGRDPYAMEGGLLHELERAVCELDPRRPSTAVRRTDVPAAGAAPRDGGAADEPARPETAEKIARARGTTVARLRRRLAGDLDTVVLKAMSKTPEDRYGSAQQMAEDVRRILEHRPVIARPTPLHQRLVKFARRNRLGAALSVALAASLVGGATGILWWAGRTRFESRRADREAAAARFEAAVALELNRFLNDMLTSVQPGTLGVDARVRDVLDQAAERLRAETPASPHVTAGLHVTIGRSYLGLGDLVRAEELFRDGLAVARTLHAPDDPRLAAYLDALAEVLVFRSELDEADRLLAEALACFRNPDDDRLAPVHATRAEVAQARGDLVRAEQLRRREVAVRRASTGLAALVLPDALSRLANVLANTPDDRTAEAEALLQEALDLERRRFPEDHPNVSSKKIELAFVLRRRGEAARALEVAEAAYQDLAARCGEENVSLAPALTLLGLLHFDLGALDPAEDRLRRALLLQRRTHGDDHPSLAYTESSLGQVLMQRGDDAGAAVLLERALAARAGTFGDDHPAVAAAAELLGTALRRTGDLAGAHDVLERALAIHARSVGERHPSHSQVLLQLAFVASARDDHVAAEALFRRVVDVEREILPPADPRRADGLFRFASHLLDRGRPAEAAPLYRELVALLEEAAPPPFDRLSIVWSRLGVALAGRGEAAAAEALLLDGHRRVAAALGDDAEPTRTVRAALARLYRATGRPEEAARYE